MYAPGKVMKSGTWSDPSFAGRTVTGRTAVIDMNQPSPVWRETAPMHHPRSFETITSLPDGTSIVTGGTSRSDGVDMSTAVLPAEIWNPETETWTEMAAQVNGRGYHSTALLLPDGRVLSAGGGQLPGYPVADQRNAEIFSPPYLFKGPRPTVLSAPSTVQHGSSFTVGVAAAGEHLQGVAGAPRLRDAHLRPEPALHPAQLHQHRRRRSACRRPRTRASRLPATTCCSSSTATACRRWPSSCACRRRTRTRPLRPRPANLTATGGLGKVDLTWTASTDNGAIRRYNVHRSTTPGLHADRRQPVAPADRHELHRQRARGRDLLLHGPGRGPGGQPRARRRPRRRDRDRRLHRPDRLDHGAGRRRHGPGSVTVTANAADAVGVSGVQFKLDGANLGGRGHQRALLRAGTPPPRPTAPTA